MQEEIEAMGVIPGYTRYLVHDFWSLYLAYKCTHLITIMLSEICEWSKRSRKYLDVSEVWKDACFSPASGAISQQ
jgi:hypothetical protein